MRDSRRPAGLALAAALVLALATATSAASADPPPVAANLLQALSRVPDRLAGQEAWIGYVDYRAVEVARPGAARPSSLAELFDSRDADDPAADLWMAATLGVLSGQGDLLRYLFQSGARWPAQVGFDFFDVDRELTFGTPPSDGLVLLGRFDPAAVGRAHEARGYVGETRTDHVVWCSADGCEAGLRVNLADVERGIPFGGDLGRHEPVAVSEGDILSSADSATLDAMLAAAAGEVPALAERPALEGFLTALDPNGWLIQATLVGPSVVIFDPALLLTEGDPGDAQARMRELEASLWPLPPWELLMLADQATAREQVVRVLLDYASAADAQVAAEVVPSRLRTLEGIAGRSQLWEALRSAGVTDVSGSVVPGAGERAVAVIELRAPLAADSPDLETGRFETSSRVYGVLIRSLMMRDTLWLMPVAPEG